MDKIKKFGLPKYPSYKNLNYTEEQLGFKRKFKGREVMKSGFIAADEFEIGLVWIVLKANRESITIGKDHHKIQMAYKEFSTNYNFVNQLS